ncbi:MAG: RNA-binding S4 domain-containing protein [Gammaproteobacteria bacterium]|nr:RNA-binding S4 domain-containing protein [Gammaproteobacteria bacterium]
MEIFELEDHEFIELNNLLKVTGFCESGGLAKIMIGDGQVKVDGKVELRKRCKIRTGQMVEYEGQKVTVK